jgi:hypothetical protein
MPPSVDHSASPPAPADPKALLARAAHLAQDREVAGAAKRAPARPIIALDAPAGEGPQLTGPSQPPRSGPGPRQP